MIRIIVIKMRGVNDVMKREKKREKKKFITLILASASSATDE